MYSGIEKNKSINLHKIKQAKKINRLLKVLKSFDDNRSAQKQKSFSNRIQNEKIGNKKDLFIKLPVQKYTFQSVSPDHRYHINRNNDNISTISKSSKFSNQKVSHPSISLDIYFPKKLNKSIYSLSSNRVKTEVTSVSPIKLPKILLNKVEGAPTGNALQFLKLKPTEKYFSKKQNVRLAQKLLLAEASKDLRRCQHKKFYKQQKSYRSISQSSLKFTHNYSTVLKKRKCHKYSKSEWIN